MTTHHLFEIRQRESDKAIHVWAIDAWAAYHWYIKRSDGGSDALVRELVEYATKAAATTPRWREIPPTEFAWRRR